MGFGTSWWIWNGKSETKNTIRTTWTSRRRNTRARSASLNENSEALTPSWRASDVCYDCCSLRETRGRWKKKHELASRLMRMRRGSQAVYPSPTSSNMAPRSAPTVALQTTLNRANQYIFRAKSRGFNSPHRNAHVQPKTWLMFCRTKWGNFEKNKTRLWFVLEQHPQVA